jgi:tetratricopeptide (TPR) repeat protein
MKKTFLSLVCLALVAGTLAAQDIKGKARIVGFVFDQNDAPLEGVTVKLYMPQAGGGFEVKSDKDGKFLAPWLRSGDWDLDFAKIGYEIKRLTVNVTEAGKNPEMKIHLKKVEGLVVTDELKKQLGEANTLFDKKDFQGALAGYAAILEKNPDAYILWKNVGHCYFALEQYDKAEEAYQKLLVKDPDNSDAQMLIGNTYANRDLTDKALEWYDKIQIEKIMDTTVLYNIGANYYNQGKFEDALRYYKQAVQIQAANLDALYQLGLTYLNLQKNPEAIGAFETILKTDPQWEKAAQVQGFLDYLKKK